MQRSAFPVAIVSALVVLLAACGEDAELVVVNRRTPTAPASATPAAATATPSATASATSTQPPTPTSTAQPTPTSTTLATATQQPTVTVTRTNSARPTRTEEPTVTRSATRAATLTATPTHTRTSASPTDTPTATPTAVLSTATETLTPTVSPTAATPTATPTATPASVATPTSTSTPTAAATATPTPTPTGGSAATATATDTPTTGKPECGNGFLEPGERFNEPGLGVVGDPNGVDCTADAAILACAAGDPRARFNVVFEAPPGTSPSSVSVAVGYRSDLVAIPGTGITASVRQRVSSAPPPPFVFTPNDRDYAVRIVLARSTTIADGTLAMLDFDTCAGAPAPAPADFGCIVESCGGSSGSIDDCTCDIVAP